MAALCSWLRSRAISWGRGIGASCIKVRKVAHGRNLVMSGQPTCGRPPDQDGEEPFPRPFEKFANALEARYHTDGWLLSFLDKWKSLNGYTHGGLEQLGRRFRSDGNIASSYPDDIVIELVTASGTLLIMMVVPIFSVNGIRGKGESA
jgi:hypothetical protein